MRLRVKAFQLPNMLSWSKFLAISGCMGGNVKVSWSCRIDSTTSRWSGNVRNTTHLDTGWYRNSWHLRTLQSTYDLKQKRLSSEETQNKQTAGSLAQQCDAQLFWSAILLGLEVALALQERRSDEALDLWCLHDRRFTASLKYQTQLHQRRSKITKTEGGWWEKSPPFTSLGPCFSRTVSVLAVPRNRFMDWADSALLLLPSLISRRTTNCRTSSWRSSRSAMISLPLTPQAQSCESHVVQWHPWCSSLWGLSSLCCNGSGRAPSSPSQRACGSWMPSREVWHRQESLFPSRSLCVWPWLWRPVYLSLLVQIQWFKTGTSPARR